MKLANVAKILTASGVNLVNGTGVEGLHVKLENGPWMPLTIEGIGVGPHGHPAVSVGVSCVIYHYFEMNGDLVQDPKMMFEVFMGELFPYAIQMSTGYYQEVYAVTDGKVTGVRLGAKRDQESFARMWSKNLGDQGFVKVAKAKAKAKS